MPTSSRSRKVTMAGKRVDVGIDPYDRRRKQSRIGWAQWCDDTCRPVRPEIKIPMRVHRGFLVTRTGISHGLKSVPRTLFPPAMPGSAFRFPHDSFKTKIPMRVHRDFLSW